MPPTGGRWVCFDVGETLIDETRVWTTWAALLGVTPFTFMAALGAVIANGQDHRDVFELVGHPDWSRHLGEFDHLYGSFEHADLYPDAIPTLDALRAADYRLALIANQPARRSAELRALGIQLDVLAMSDELGVHKPSPEFYAQALELMAADPRDVVYVGDRLDNDVRPALAAGMRSVWIRRGPWALVVRDELPAGAMTVDSLDELVRRIDEAWQ